MGGFRDEPMDENGDTFYEGLLFEAETDIAQQSHYLLQAELWAGGRRIARAEQVTELNPGMHWLAVQLDGVDIRDGGRDCPYEVRNLMLIDQSQAASILVDTLDNAYHTAAYNHRAFGTPYTTFLPSVANSP